MRWRNWMATGSDSDDDPAAEQERPAHMERRRWPREPAMRKERPPHASPALVPLRFSTQDLPPAEQFQPGGHIWRRSWMFICRRENHRKTGSSRSRSAGISAISSSSSSARRPTDMSAIRPCFDRAPSTIGTSACSAATKLDRGQPSCHRDRCRRDIVHVSRQPLSRTDDRYRSFARVPAV